MENKDYVSYELAKKLYELDFDWDSEMAYFDRPWNHEHKLVSAIDASNQAAAYDGTDVYSAPTLWEAQKWLREGKGIAVYVIPRFRNGYEVAAKELRKCIIDTHYLFDLWDSTKPYPTYESALSSGISAVMEILGKEAKK